MKEEINKAQAKDMIDLYLKEAIKSRNETWRHLVSEDMRKSVENAPEHLKTRYRKLLQCFNRRAKYLMALDNLKHLRFRVSLSCDLLNNNAEVLFATINSIRFNKFYGEEIEQLKAANEARTKYYVSKEGELK